MLPASLVALPLRVGPDGRLARRFRVMVATSARAWPHAPWFDPTEVVAEANPQLEDWQGVADARNRALDGLGVQWATVPYVRSVPAPYGERTFRVALALEGGRVPHAALST